MRHFKARRSFTLLLACLLGCATGAANADESSQTITVFAASSLTDAVKAISDAYTRTHHTKVTPSFAASSSLAKQIAAGARADVFFSADVDWMDYLQQRNLLDAATRHNVVANQLVLIAPADSHISLKIAPHFPLAKTLQQIQGRLTTGDPDSVPVGRYARTALTSLGIWDQVAARLVRAENVRVALAYVARGEAALGIVYQTDARIDQHVRIVDVFPESSHAPIVYPIAVTRTASKAAREYLAFVRGPEAATIFTRYGFTPIH